MAAMTDDSLRKAEGQLYEELGFCWKRVNSVLQVTTFGPFKIESLRPCDPSYEAHFKMDKAWEKFVELRERLSRAEGLLERAHAELFPGSSLEEAIRDFLLNGDGSRNVPTPLDTAKD